MRPSLFWRVRSADWMRSACGAPRKRDQSAPTLVGFWNCSFHTSKLRSGCTARSAQRSNVRPARKRWQMPAPPRPLCLPEMAASNTGTQRRNRCSAARYSHRRKRPFERLPTEGPSPAWPSCCRTRFRPRTRFRSPRPATYLHCTAPAEASPCNCWPRRCRRRSAMVQAQTCCS